MTLLLLSGGGDEEQERQLPGEARRGYVRCRRQAYPDFPHQVSAREQGIPLKQLRAEGPNPLERRIAYCRIVRGDSTCIFFTFLVAVGSWS